MSRKVTAMGPREQGGAIVTAQDLPPVLESCPFCGNVAILHRHCEGQGADQKLIAVYVACNTFKPNACGAAVMTTPLGCAFTHEADAIAAWNRRSLRAERDAVLELAAVKAETCPVMDVHWRRDIAAAIRALKAEGGGA